MLFNECTQLDETKWEGSLSLILNRDILHTLVKKISLCKIYWNFKLRIIGCRRFFPYLVISEKLKEINWSILSFLQIWTVKGK
jgi:hypothetical protein